MSLRNLIIVESPSKAKTINRYLGADYKVLASFGHIRDLSPKSGSVDPDQDFAMTWEVNERGEKNLRDIQDALGSSDRLILATDPDREGEAISWHLVDELKGRGCIDGKSIERVTFHEITRSAIQKAMNSPVVIDQGLVEAYLARRALDYLVGFTLSPVLWRKLPGAKSAGRVQSVALRLISEREMEIEAFKPQPYWELLANFSGTTGVPFEAKLALIGDEKLDGDSIRVKEQAQAALKAAEEASDYKVKSIKTSRMKRQPAPPFTTSTLQQEANRKLGFPASRTMRAAQRLYEGVDLGSGAQGMITYMRTDSVHLAAEAITAAREAILNRYGNAYLPKQPRQYKNKSANAQEAHEAIRPTDFTIGPDQMRGHVESDLMAIYQLVWSRAMASQMESSELEQVRALIHTQQGDLTFRANGRVTIFDGFRKAYSEDRDDVTPGSDNDQPLPKMSEGEALKRVGLKLEDKETRPPPRFTEASLIKRMEELGIGRPSTYVSIIKVLQDREYAALESSRFRATDRGRLVSAFLFAYFERFFEYSFTAKMEEELDAISRGELSWKDLLQRFWGVFSDLCEESMKLSALDVRDELDRVLGPHFFPVDDKGSDEAARTCPRCSKRLILNFGRFGAYIACSTHPECTYSRNIDDREGTVDTTQELPRALGPDPDTGLEITLRKGPFGIYAQVGEAEGKKKPKRGAIPKDLPPDDVDLKTALQFLSLPRQVGKHPNSEKIIEAGLGPYGAYLRHDGKYARLEGWREMLSIGMNRAVELLEQQATKGGGSSRRLGEHPETGKVVAVRRGRFGPYVSHNSVNATIPKSENPEEITLELALELLKAREAAGPIVKRTKATRTKTDRAKKTSKPAVKKTTKAPAKKKAAKAAPKALAETEPSGETT